MAINLINKFGSNALQLAVENDDCATVEILLKSKEIDINIKNQLGRTPIFCAISKNNFAIFQKLLEFGADYTIPDQNGCTTFYEAVFVRNFDILNELIKVSNAKIDAVTRDSEKPQEFVYEATPFDAVTRDNEKPQESVYKATSFEKTKRLYPYYNRKY